MSDEEEEETQQTNKFLGQRILLYRVLKVDWRNATAEKAANTVRSHEVYQYMGV